MTQGGEDDTISGMEADVTKAEGIMRGLVVDRKDPDRKGRVRVLVPSVYLDTPTDSLPWAEPCALGGGYDFGSLVVPEEGSTVFVMFEDNDPDSPVYLGACYAADTEEGKGYNKCENEDPKAKLFSKSGGAWTSKKNDFEAPHDAYIGDSTEPDRRVIYKSQKGSTILVSDVDGEDFIEIIDPAGQSFRLSAEIDPEEEANNGAQRGLNNYRSGVKDTHNAKVKSTKLELFGKGYSLTIDSRGVQVTGSLLEGLAKAMFEQVYIVDSVYEGTTLPEPLKALGTWESVGGTAWRRTS